MPPTVRRQAGDLADDRVTAHAGRWTVSGQSRVLITQNRLPSGSARTMKSASWG